MIKRKRHSKTLWFNTALLVGFGVMEAAAILFQAALPEMTYTVLVAVSGIGNIALRFFTVEPIK